MNGLTGFDFEGVQVRTVLRDGEPWFVAADVCAVLEINNPSDALRRLDDDERTLVSIEGASNGLPVNAVNEPGLYALVLGSRKPDAKRFQRWVRHEVLPSIRRTGGYSVQSQEPPTMSSALLQAAQIIHEHEQRLSALAATQEQHAAQLTVVTHRVDSLDAANIEGDLRQRLAKMVKRFAWASGLMYAAAWREFDQRYNTAFRTNLTALRQNFAARNGLRDISRPDFLERTGRLEDAIRIADKLLASAGVAS